MHYKSVLAAAVLANMAGLLPLLPSSATAQTPSTTVSSVTPTQGPVGTTVTIEGTNVGGTTSVSPGQTADTLVVEKSTRSKAQFPSGAGTSAVDVSTPGGRATRANRFLVTAPLGGVVSVAGSNNSYCALVTSGQVDCWGAGWLGDGADGDSALPVAVVAVGGSGTLSGVVSLASDGVGECALLTSGGVDCWGAGDLGQLGNGVVYQSSSGSAVPVAVVAVGGSGTLSGVVSLESNGAGYCALLETDGVDCWGDGYFGALGDGVFNTIDDQGSAVPVAVIGIGGSGTLGGVVSLASNVDTQSYCALLTSGGVDCWGEGYAGDLGDGLFYTTGNEGSAIPVTVVGIGDTGSLSGVTSLVSDGNGAGFCALLASGGVDCWGYGAQGDLGDGVFYNTRSCGCTDGSAVPVAVLRHGGGGTLGGVVNLAGEGAGWCALLVSGGADCWGYDVYGELGHGVFTPSSPGGKAIPVAVRGVGGSGTLGGVVSLSGDQLGYSFAPADGGAYCALLTSDRVDCWGAGLKGELGDGLSYGSGTQGSAVPVKVLGVGGSGTLGGVASLASDGVGFCSLLLTGRVDCWGADGSGQLGDGVFHNSAAPVSVESDSTG